MELIKQSMSVVAGSEYQPIVNEPFWLVLNMQGAANLYAVDSYLRYTHGEIEVMQDATGKPIWQAGTVFPQDLIDVVFVDNLPGELNMSCSLQGNAPGKNGSGELLQIKMLPKKEGRTALMWGTDCAAFSPELVGNELKRLPAKFLDYSFLVVQTGGDGLIFFLTVKKA